MHTQIALTQKSRSRERHEVVQVEQPSETERENPFVITDCVITNCSTVNIIIGKEKACNLK